MLDEAIANRHADMARAALKLGADAWTPLPTGMTRLMMASARRDAELVKVLLPGSDPMALSQEGKSALSYALQALDESCVKLLAPVSDLWRLEDGLNSLMRAAQKSKPELLAAILSVMGEDVEAARATQEDGCNALMLACAYDREANARALIPLSDLSAVDKEGRAAMHWAAMADTAGCARALIPFSDLRLRDAKGKTPLELVSEGRWHDELRRVIKIATELQELEGVMKKSLPSSTRRRAL